MPWSSLAIAWTEKTYSRLKYAGRRLESVPWIIVLCAAGVALRWTGLGSSALWYDEAYSVMMSRLGLLEMIGALQTNISPPAWEIILWLVTRVLGENDFAFRIVPFIASGLTLYVFWRLTQVLQLNRLQAIFGLALLVLSPYQLWLAQEARMYALMSLLYLLGVLWAWQGRYLGLAAVMGLLLWIHNTAVFYFLPLGLFALIVHPRDWRVIVRAGGVALLAWLPWAPIVFRQSGQSIPWLEPLTWQMFTFNFVFDLFASTALGLGGSAVPVILFYLSLVFALAIQAIALGRWLASRKGDAGESALSLEGIHERWDGVVTNAQAWVPAFMFWVPLMLFLASSIFFRNALFYRSTSVLIPPLMLWLAVALIPSCPRVYHAILPGIWIFLFVVSLLVWSPKDRGRNLAEVLEVIKSGWQSGDIVYHANEMTAVLFSYYLPNVPHYVIDEQELAGGRGMIEQAKLDIHRAALEQISHRRAWLVSPYYDYASPPDELMADRRMRVYTSRCSVVGIISYWQHAWVGVSLCGDLSSSGPQLNR